MLQCMFLCWRWWRRDDLPALLRCTADPEQAQRSLPELAGFARFEAAASRAFDAKESVLDQLLVDSVVNALPAEGVCAVLVLVLRNCSGTRM